MINPTRVILFFIGMGLAMATGCVQSEGETKEAEPINVVVYLVDTLRADRIGAYGYSRANTPVIDQLAKDGVLFENCYAPAPWTVPSTMSLHTSLYPNDHGVLVDGNKIPPSVMPMAARMKQAGYWTAGYICNPWAGVAVGLEKGYDVYVKKRFFVRHDLIERAISTNSTRPYYFYIHPVEPHRPYEPPEDFIERIGRVPPRMIQHVKKLVTHYVQLTKADFVAGRPLGSLDNTEEQQAVLRKLAELKDVINLLYDAEVAFCDDNLGKIIDVFKRRDMWNNTLFIFLSDHGEEINDHGGHQHDQSLYNELVHVPMIIKFPQNRFTGRRFSDNVSLVDVLPTIMEYIDRSDLAHDCEGRSLLSLIEQGKRESPHPLTVRSIRINKKKYFKPYKEARGDFNISLTQGNLKGIWNVEPDTFELYDLKADPGERSNLSASKPEQVDRMRDFAAKWLKTRPKIEKSQEDATLDESIMRQLRDLGYVH